MARPKHETKTAIQKWILDKMSTDPQLFALVDIKRSKNRQHWLDATSSDEARQYIATPWGAMDRMLAAAIIVSNWDSTWSRRMVTR